MQLTDAAKRELLEAGAHLEGDGSKKSLSTLISLLTQNNLMSGAPTSLESFIWQHNTQIWVYRCIRVKVNAAIRMAPKVYSVTRKGGIKRRTELMPEDHKASALIGGINPWDNPATFSEKIWTSLGLAGMFYYYYDDAKGELWHLRPDKVEIVTDSKEFIKAFRYNNGNQKMTIPAQSVVFGKYYNPNNEWYGLSPMQAAKNSINSYLRAQQWNLNFFENSAMPLGLLTTEYHFNNQDEIDLLKKQWDELYKGWDKWGGTAIVGGGLKYDAITPTHKDMMFTSLLDKAKEEIGSAFGVPMLFMNDREGINYANAREYERILWRETIIPEKILVENVITKFLNDNFARSGETLQFVYDISQVEALKDDIVKEAEAARIRIHSGQNTVNEERERKGDAPYEGVGDDPVFQLSFVRLDQVGDILGNKQPATFGDDKGAAIKAVKGEDARLKHWLKTKDIVEGLEGKMRKVLVAVFTDWQEEILNRLRTGKAAQKSIDVEDVLFDLEGAKEILGRAGGPILEDAVAKGGKRALVTTGSSAAFDLHDPAVEAMLAQAIQRFKEEIAPVRWERLRDSLNEGLRGGETMDELAARVQDVMGHEINNAPTIARTEVLPRYHEGQVAGMEQSGVVEKMEWLSAFTETSREEHMAANGQVVALDSAFEVGGEYLRYPGDPGGSASNTINCLCDVLPVVEEGKGIFLK